jgi:hypothetical protein
MSPRIYQVDSNHVGIRLAVLGTFALIGFVGAFIGIPALIRLLGLTNIPLFCLASIGGIALGAGAAWVLERVLMRVWPSGHTLRVDGAGLELKRRRSDPITISWADRISVLSWYFVVRRSRSWVPRGWLCLACHLRQDETMIIPYTFASPSVAGDLSQWAGFEELLPPPPRPGVADGHPVERASRQGQLHGAEGDRWMDGCELAAGDFADLIARLDERLAYWPG